ncbi:MAG: transposase [Bacteroidales bacterium]|nr:transposase [Bacteroidales bacterium]
MHFETGNIYHIYNMGNNSQKVFFTDENYLFFLRKIRNEIFCEILAYCLMPNHFHPMILANKLSVDLQSDSRMQILTRKLGNLTSSYSQALNKQQQMKGSIFRQKTKAKNLSQFITYPNLIHNYLLTCFFYIHQNPLTSGLVDRLEDWKYSSYLDFAGLRSGTLCNIAQAYNILNIDQSTFIHSAPKPTHTDELKHIW